MKIIRVGKVLIVFIILITVGSGCCSVINGTQKELMLTSTPPAVKVSVDGFYRGETPMQLILKRGDAPFLVKFEKNGYKISDLKIRGHISGWFWANFLWSYAFPIAMIVDGVNGSWNELAPEQYHASLELNEAKPMENKMDILYLKNGSILHGNLKEIRPDKQYTIILDDGSELTYPTDQVIKFEKK